jgi:hypothetical protein
MNDMMLQHRWPRWHDTITCARQGHTFAPDADQVIGADERFQT